MALLEQEMVRFAEALDDYENVSVADMGGWGPDGFWVVVTDERFGISYEIASHCDYWDLIGAVVEHRQCKSLTPLDVPRSVPSGCELGPQDQTKRQGTPLPTCVRAWVLSRRGRRVRRTTDRRRNQKEVA